MKERSKGGEEKIKTWIGKGREASPVRGLRAFWKLSFGLGPSAVVELSCFICFQLCECRQMSDHCCSAWLAVPHKHKYAHTHNHRLKALSHMTDSIFNFSV